MKQFAKIFPVLFVIITGAGVSSAATITSVASGNWNAGSTWVGGTAPGAGDNAVIANGHTVTLTSNKTISNFTVNAGGIFNDGGFNLNVSGNFVINGSYNGNGVGRINLTGNGKTIDGTGFINNVNRVDMTASTSKTILASANITFTGTNQRISVRASNTVTNNGTITLQRITGSNAATSVWVNAANSTLTVSVDLLSTGTLTANATGNTVNYNGSAAQAIKTAIYHHLLLSNTNTKTAGGNLTVNGNLTVSGTAVFHAGTSRTHNFYGNWIVNSSALSPFVYATSSILSLNTPVTPAPTSLTGTTASSIGFDNVNINNTSGFISGLNFNVSGNFTVASGVTFTPAAPVVINNALPMGTITGNGTVIVTKCSSSDDYLNQYKFLTHALSNLTVDYAGTLAQTASAVSYGSLTLSNAFNTVSAAGHIFVNGILSLNSNIANGDLNMGVYTLTMGGAATTLGNGDVTGIVKRTVINPNTEYSFGNRFTTITFPATGTLPSDMSIKISIGAATTWKNNSVLRFYDICRTGGSGYKATVKLHYLDSELNENSESSLVQWHRHNDTTIVSHSKSAFNSTDNWVEQSNWGTFPTAFGNFSAITLGNSDMQSCVWIGAVSSEWAQPDNWMGGLPEADDDVVIPQVGMGFYTPVISSDVAIHTLMIESGGILDGGTGTNITLGGSSGAWMNEGVFNAGTSTVIFTNAAATMAGETDFYNVTIGTGAGLTMETNTIMRIRGAVVNSGSWKARTLVNTVEYNGTNQSVLNPNGGSGGYFNLILSNSGVKTAASSLSVFNDFEIGGTAVFDAGMAMTHTFSGNWVVNSSAAAPFQFTNSSTLNFNSQVPPSATSLTGSTLSALNFNTLNVNNTSGFSSTLNFNISGMLAIGANAVFTPASSVVINEASAQGNITGTGIVKVTRTAATAEFLSQYRFLTNDLTNLTVDYAGNATQYASALSYGNLTISNTVATVIAAGNITVNGILSLAAGLSEGDLDMNGNTLLMGSGATTAGTGDVTGIIKRTTIASGTAYSFGNPFTTLLFGSQGTLPSEASVKVSIGSVPSWKTDAVNRFYDIIQTGGSGFSATVQLHYSDAELNGIAEDNVAVFDNDDFPEISEHGSSGNNSTENWVSLSNYTHLETNFGVTSGWTLGNRTITSVVWKGDNSTDWTDPGNWTGGVPLAISNIEIPDASSTLFDPALPASATINSISIASGGILNGGSGELTILGDSGWRNNGTFNPQSSAIVFNGEASVISGTSDFFNVTIESGRVLTAAAGTNLRISGNLVNEGDFDAFSLNNTIEFNGSGQSIPDIGGYRNLIISGNGIQTLPAVPITINGDFSVAGTAEVNANAIVSTGGNFTINAGAVFNAGIFTHYIGGNFSNSGTFNAGQSCFYLNGVSVQTIENNAGTSQFYSLTIDKPAGNVLLSENAEISNVLSLFSGGVDLNGFHLSLNNGSSNAIMRTSGCIISENTANENQLKWNIGAVTGNHIFPFGTSTGIYIPFTFNLLSGNAGNVTVSTYPTTPNNCPLPITPVAVASANDAANAVDRFWQIDKEGASVTADMIFSYADSEMPENGEDELAAQRWNGSEWEDAAEGQTFNQASNTVTIYGVSEFSPWAVARKNSPLPVTLLNFEARWESRVLILGWKTLAELNNDYFTVERSGDGMEFHELERIKGAGNSNEMRAYGIMDKNPFTGTSYYRLKQTDYDGNHQYSEIISVSNCTEEVNALDLYPNPSAGVINLCFKGNKAQVCSVEIFDVNGSMIYHSDTYQAKIDLSGLPCGLYLLHFNLTTEVIVRKIELNTIE